MILNFNIETISFIVRWIWFQSSYEKAGSGRTGGGDSDQATASDHQQRTFQVVAGTSAGLRDASIQGNNPGSKEHQSAFRQRPSKQGHLGGGVRLV